MVKKAKKERITERNSSAQMQPVEKLMNIELFLGKTGFVLKIGTQMLDAYVKAFIACMRNNTDVFTFSSIDLIDVDASIVMHSLNIDPTARPFK